MQCSDPASEVVSVGQIVHNIVLRFLNVPDIQEQLLEPGMEVERCGQGTQVSIPEVLYVPEGHKVQEPLLRSFQVHSVPEGQPQLVPLSNGLEPKGHSRHSRAPS